MSEQTLAVIKQPTRPTILRGSYFLVFGILMIYAAFNIGEDFFNYTFKIPFILIIPAAGIIFPVLGIGNLIIAASNSGFKEIPVTVSDGKLILHGHILETPIFSRDKIIELNSNVQVIVKKGSISPLAPVWWKLRISDGEKTVKLRIFEFVSGNLKEFLTKLAKRAE